PSRRLKPQDPRDLAASGEPSDLTERAPVPSAVRPLVESDSERLELEDLLEELKPTSSRTPSRLAPPLDPAFSRTPPAGIPVTLPQSSLMVSSGVTIGVSRGTPLPPPPGEPPPMGMDACLARLGVGLVETDATGRIVRMNEAAERLLHVTVADGPFTIDDVL